MPWDRAWLLTWTCYGNWLPGDRRGFVAQFIDDLGDRVLHNEPGTEYDRDITWLHSYCRQIQTYPTVRLSNEQAMAVLGQFRETATWRGWELAATAIMANHLHLVVLVAGDPEPSKLLESFKSYASRRLNALFGKQPWWTRSGSTVKLPNAQAVQSAVAYVRRQEYPLLVWVAEDHAPVLEGSTSIASGEAGEPTL